jgi:hypothetical protein
MAIIVTGALCASPACLAALTGRPAPGLDADANQAETWHCSSSWEPHPHRRPHPPGRVVVAYLDVQSPRVCRAAGAHLARGDDGTLPRSRLGGVTVLTS